MICNRPENRTIHSSIQVSFTTSQKVGVGFVEYSLALCAFLILDARRLRFNSRKVLCVAAKNNSESLIRYSYVLPQFEKDNPKPFKY